MGDARARNGADVRCGLFLFALCSLMFAAAVGGCRDKREAELIDGRVHAALPPAR